MTSSNTTSPASGKTEQGRASMQQAYQIVSQELAKTVNQARVTLEDGSWVLARASSNKPEFAVVVESMRSEEDMIALFREEVKPRLAKYPEIGAYNQEI